MPSDTRLPLSVTRALMLAFAVVAALGSVPGVEAGPRGRVEIEGGEPIEVRALLSGTVVPSVSPLIETAVGLAIEDYGPIHGRRVAVEILDEKCSGEGGRAAAEAIVADAQVVGVIGTLCSGAAVEAAPVLSAASLSMVSPANTSPVPTSDLAGNAGPHHHKGYYRVTDNDLIEASVVAHFAYDELGLRRVVTVHDGDAYTSAIVNAFAREFTEHGGAVPVVAKVEKGQSEMGAVLARFDEAGPRRRVHPAVSGRGGGSCPAGGKFESLRDVTMIGGAATLTTKILALPETEGMYFRGPDPGHGGQHERGDGQKRGAGSGGDGGRVGRAADLAVLGGMATMRRRCCSRPSSRRGAPMGRRSRSIAAQFAMHWAGRRSFGAFSVCSAATNLATAGRGAA